MLRTGGVKVNLYVKMENSGLKPDSDNDSEGWNFAVSGRSPWLQGSLTQVVLAIQDQLKLVRIGMGCFGGSLDAERPLKYVRCVEKRFGLSC
jgi:hypothetical protein